MMIQEIAPTQTEAVNELVSRAFGYGGNASFLDDFPVWASPLPEVVRLGIFERGKLVSHVGIRYCEMRTPQSSVPAALIGAVATEAADRGKGFSTALLKEALKRIDASGCGWTLLWGSEHEFYKKLGFKLHGQQARAPLASLTSITKLEPGKNLSFSAEGVSGMTESIFQNLLNEKNGILLKPSDRPWIFAHKTIEWLSLKEPFAFVAFQRGMDLHHIVHEFGGDTPGIQVLLQEIYERDPIAQVMGKYESLLKMGFLQQDILQEFLCLARPRDATQKWNPHFWVSGISAC